MTLYFIAGLTVLLHLSFAGMRVLLSLYALHLQARPLTVGLLMALSFTLGVVLGGTQPMIMAVLFNSAPAGCGGEAVGVRTLLLNMSQAGIPLIFGALGAALGMAPVFWTMAGAFVAGGWYARKRSF